VRRPLLVLCAGLAGCPASLAPPDAGAPLVYTETREPCANRNPLRNPYFGDLHVHTGLSFDAWANDVRTTPADAYRFAKGEEITVVEGLSFKAKLARPLDFAAVTDHAEFFAEVNACVDPSAPGYGSSECLTFRAAGAPSVTLFGSQLTPPVPDRLSLCQGNACLSRLQSVWQQVQRDAAEAYDRTKACRFTSFVGYEYSAAPGAANMHRNVVFRNANVPASPTSYFEAATPAALWRALEASCTADAGCEAVVIPHNSNLSNGRMFLLQSADNGGAEDQVRRARLERLAEVFQHKGDSECMNGLALSLGGTDELCGFEKTRDATEDCGTGIAAGGLGGLGCVSGRDFVRRALGDGLAYQAARGFNPLKLGMIASTDTHNGTPGAVEEDLWEGHVGKSDYPPTNRLDGPTLPPGGVVFNPGGLAGVWAQENSRDAIFEALTRREVWGTSGPRIVVRFFGGSGLDAALCSDPQLVEKAYARGVPMGGDLPAGPAAPKFLVQVLADPGTATRPAVPIDRVQIVKGTLDAQNRPVAKVFEVIRGGGDFATDPATCASTGSGALSLCGAFTDPEFDPARPAWYYARVVEAQTCRWSQKVCSSTPVATRPAACSDPRVPKQVAERAWSSPIWFTP